MHFHWRRIILSNKICRVFDFVKKQNSLWKVTLNPLGWSEIRKTEINPTRILPKPKIHLTRILPEPKDTRPVFNPPVRIDRSIYIYTHTCVYFKIKQTLLDFRQKCQSHEISKIIHILYFFINEITQFYMQYFLFQKKFL